MRFRTFATALSFCVASLTGCSEGTSALVQTARHVVGRSNDFSNVQLNPNFQYLRVTIAGRVVFLALGDVDPHPRGAIEVWYSAEKEVIRLQNGRIVGAVGLTAEWRSVSLPELPVWSSLATAQKSHQWTRSRDLMPGYHFGLQDSLVLRVVPPPNRSALQGLDPTRLTWFEESFDNTQKGDSWRLFANGDDTNRVLPPARYAVNFQGGRESVVYGEQCLTPDVCFTWQRWAAAPQKPVEKN